MSSLLNRMLLAERESMDFARRAYLIDLSNLHRQIERWLVTQNPGTDHLIDKLLTDCLGHRAALDLARDRIEELEAETATS